ncbi:DUF2971 domain-containing protein [Hydrogenophaga palleronii]|uniref:DUF2971 domain-containing protein n=1 Tax=Hydrogenophaga palleronii TaxID=65655 RepID=UPI000823FB87|nr:DUF2971 domain-containing protein [Hydrogenophaga palleronii]
MSLYKYFHPDRTDVLLNRSIRFSSPAVLNDPFELKPHLAVLASPDCVAAALRQAMPSLLEDEFSKLPIEQRRLLSPEVLQTLMVSQFSQTQKAVEDMAAHLIPGLQGVMARKLEEQVGILCLTESADNLLMWAHYADSHRGFVLEFDDCSPFFDCRVNLKDELRHLRKVTYSIKRPSLTLSEVDDFSAFMTKGLEWQYEAEWRMIQPLSSASRIIGDGPEAIHLFEFPAEAIRGVILGARMPEAKKVEIRGLLSQSPRYSHVRCVDARVDDEHYRVRVS